MAFTMPVANTLSALLGKKEYVCSNLLNFFFFVFRVYFQNLLSVQLNYTEHSKNHSKVTLKYIFLLKKINNFFLRINNLKKKKIENE